mgnify:CR=1 FL=1
MPEQKSAKNADLKLTQMSDSELLAVVNDSENVNSLNASGELLFRLLRRVRQLEKEVLLLSGQADKKARKRKVYYYEDVELTDELLVEYIDTEAFTVYELEKIVGAKKNVLRNRYKNAKKKIQALKCQNTE